MLFSTHSSLFVYHYIFPPLILTYIGITTCFSSTHPNVYWYITMFFFHTFKRILVYNCVIPPLTQTYIGIKSHSDDLFSKTLHPWSPNFTCSMTRLQGFKKIKFSLVENRKWPLSLKIGKPLKSTFPHELLDTFG